MLTLNKIAIRVGLAASAVIITLWIIGQLTIYHYFKTEYYVAIVAIVFLVGGIIISRSKHSNTTNDITEPLAQLTQKELSILTQIAIGKSNKEIAASNFVELSTIKTHINNIYGKLGVTNRREAIKAYTSIKSE